MTVQETARSVAADIRRQGHYQAKPGQRMYRYSAPNNPCCVLANPTAHAQGLDAILALETALDEAEIGHSTVVWNDKTPTAQVLAKLDEIAAA